MILLGGVIVLVGVIAALLFDLPKRRKDPEPQDKEDLQALMEHDLQELSAPSPKEPEEADSFGTVPARDTADDVPLVEHDAETEELFLLWQDEDGTDPLVSVAPDDDNPSLTQIFVNGGLVARVFCAQKIRAEDVSVMPHSAAASLGIAA